MRHALVGLLVIVATACAANPVSTEGPAVAQTTMPEATVVVSAPTTVPSEAPVASGPDPQVRSITVGGMGAKYAEPDRCTIDIGVSSRRPTVSESSLAAAASADAMMIALREFGVETTSIQTSEFSVNPYYEDWPAITGYETHIGYRVVMPNLDDVGAILAAAVSAGGDDVRAWGIRFETDPTVLMDGARAQAWEDVMARAESLAALAGEPLGQLLDAHEKVLVSTSHGMMEGGEGDSAAYDIPVSPGVSGVVVLLTVTFAIGD